MSRLHDGRPHTGGVCPQSSQISPSGTDEGASWKGGQGCPRGRPGRGAERAPAMPGTTGNVPTRSAAMSMFAQNA